MSAFGYIENKHSLYCGEDCIKNFFSSLIESVTNVLIFEKKEMLPLTKKPAKLYQDATEYYIFGERFS